MLDVYAHIASLELLHERLKRESLSGALTGPNVTTALDAMAHAYPFAVLGSIIDHLLAHDGPSKREVALLQDARTIHQDAGDYLQRLRGVRSALEGIAANPAAPAALAAYNAMIGEVNTLVSSFEPLAAKIRGFGWKLRPLRHLRGHPLAQDRPLSDWPWRDVHLSRRTGALASEILRRGRALGTPEALAFGLGAVAGYVGNAIGSPYLVHGVGGPRRSHPYRDRLASYAVGTWVRNAPLAAGKPVLRHIPRIGSPNKPRLPDWLPALIHEALANTYPAGAVTARLPDVDAAYGQLLEHFELLGQFPSFAPPQPIDDDLDLRVVNTLQPQDAWRPDDSSGQPGPAPDGGSGKSIFDPGPNQPPWFMEQHNNAWDVIKEICMDVLLLPFFLVRVGFWIGHEAGDDEPKPPSGGSPAPFSGSAKSIRPRTQAEFDAIMAGNDVLIAVDTLYQLDACMHRMTERALKGMKVFGLLYPEDKDLPDPTYRQFVVLPPAALPFTWPARPLSDIDLFLRPPASGVELPPAPPSGFLPGEKPWAFLIDTGGSGGTVFNQGFGMWREELLDLPTSPLRNANLNLDADRTVSNACWALPPGASINDSPVNEVILGYADV